ncbi:MAG: CPBP family intramembrane metalloprotease [Propionibacteriaceae bacterium]|nr:CPBP family intramembrane metalloprotease [Propionibacteriaceae bacterium]
MEGTSEVIDGTNVRTDGAWARVKRWAGTSPVDIVPLDDRHARRTLVGETFIVLGVSLGLSAISSVLQWLDVITRHVQVSTVTTVINSSATPDRPWLDLSYQLYDVIYKIVPVLLVLFLLAQVRPSARSPFATMGLDCHRPGFDLGWAFALAAIIGIPGLGVYELALHLGINTQVSPANLANNWWTIPVYILFAFANGALEEIVMIGYVVTRWLQAGARWWVAVLGSALIRGTYHLYQGWGGFIGNAAMGAILGFFFYKTKRVWPLVIAHTILDVVSFVGYALLKNHLGWLQ